MIGTNDPPVIGVPVLPLPQLVHEEEVLTGGRPVVGRVLVSLVLVLIPAGEEVEAEPGDERGEGKTGRLVSLPGGLLDGGGPHTGHDDPPALLPVVTHVLQHPGLEVVQELPVQLLALLLWLEGVGRGPVGSVPWHQGLHQEREAGQEQHGHSHNSHCALQHQPPPVSRAERKLRSACSGLTGGDSGESRQR